jgi:hypothetical protein
VTVEDALVLAIDAGAISTGWLRTTPIDPHFWIAADVGGIVDGIEPTVLEPQPAMRMPKSASDKSVPSSEGNARALREFMRFLLFHKKQRWGRKFWRDTLVLL